MRSGQEEAEERAEPGIRRRPPANQRTGKQTGRRKAHNKRRPGKKWKEGVQQSRRAKTRPCGSTQEHKECRLSAGTPHVARPRGGTARPSHAPDLSLRTLTTQHNRAAPAASRSWSLRAHAQRRRFCLSSSFAVNRVLRNRHPPVAMPKSTSMPSCATATDISGDLRAPAPPSSGVAAVADAGAAIDAIIEKGETNACSRFGTLDQLILPGIFVFLPAPPWTRSRRL